VRHRTSAPHLHDIDAPPDSGQTPLLVLDFDSLADFIFLSRQGVERHGDIRRKIVHLDGENVALSNRDPGGSKKCRAHAGGVLNILAGGFENFVRDDALRGFSLDGAEKDEPEQERSQCKDGSERKENISRKFYHFSGLKIARSPRNMQHVF
jgi:hypothetical protein